MTELAAVLATLLPGDAPWPSGAVVADAVAADLAPGDWAALSASLPGGFTAGDEAALRAVEQQHPAAFERMVTAAYLAYYTEPSVRAVLEQVTGYEARPPQPLGYQLEPFDETLLERQRLRAPFWRDPDAPV